MAKFFLASLAIGLAALSASASANGLGEAGEAEAARHNARAGGPTNYRDAELLARYGCFDKHDSEFCWNLYKKQQRHLYGLSRRSYRD